MSGARRVDLSGLGLPSSALTRATISSPVHLVGLIASRCGFQQLLFEQGVRFGDCGSMFPPGWPGSYRLDTGVPRSESFHERLDGLSHSLFSSQKGGHHDFRVIFEEAVLDLKRGVLIICIECD